MHPAPDQQDRERERLERVARNRRDAADIVADLRALGFAVDGVADLFNQRHDYRLAVPVLLNWLPRIDNQYVKEDMVRALSIKWAKPAAIRPMLEEFRRAPDSATSLKWAIGNALEVLADDSSFEDIAKLAQDKRHGRAREMLALALGKMKTPQATEILIELLKDEQIAGHAVAGLRRRAPAQARPFLEPFLEHPQTWVRNEAKAALAKIDRKLSAA